MQCLLPPMSLPNLWDSSTHPTHSPLLVKAVRLLTSVMVTVEVMGTRIVFRSGTRNLTTGERRTGQRCALCFIYFFFSFCFRFLFSSLVLFVPTQPCAGACSLR